MKNKTVFAQSVINISILNKWKATTLHLGVKVEKRPPKTVRCFAKHAIEQNRIYNPMQPHIMRLFLYNNTILQFCRFSGTVAY